MAGTRCIYRRSQEVFTQREHLNDFRSFGKFRFFALVNPLIHSEKSRLLSGLGQFDGPISSWPIK